MTWDPREQVFDLTPLVDNLLAYIELNAPAALAWASGGNEGEFPTFKGLYPNATGRIATLFPQVMVLDQEIVVKPSDNQGDLLNGIFALTWEGAVTGKTADETTLKIKTYSKALESMLVNCVLERTADNTLKIADGCDPEITDAVCLGYQTAHDQVGKIKKSSNWLQIFQTRVEYRLTTPAFS